MKRLVFGVLCVMAAGVLPAVGNGNVYGV